MEKPELLSQFQAKVEEFTRYHAFIEKAKAQADRFAPEVVQKVISGNTEKAEGVVVDLIPLTDDVVGVIRELRGDRQKVESDSSESSLRMQELELRHAIGELDDEGFEKESADLKVEVETAQARIAEIDSEIASFTEALESWNKVGLESGMLHAAVTVDEPEPEPEPEPDPEPEQEEAPIDLGEEPDVEIVEVDAASVEELPVDAAADGAGVHAEQVSIQDDLSVVFDDADDDDDADDEESPEEELVLGDDILPAEDDGGLDILGDDEPLELEGAEPVNDLKPRRAVLLQSESSPDEQVHPVTKDVISIGRGRDNDIQVRNDAKVSRYHCKIYRRGPNYYIEDNKSANGSLVNGELITERRLFGGEEIIVGETFFRFRIMD